MVKVTIGNNVERKNVIVNPADTLKTVLEQNNIDYSRGVMHMDGVSLGAGELNKTFADFGLDGTDGHNKCFLLNVVKTDNA